jgi:glycosyltransferase involved in cell wall biosynthesis
VLHLIDSGGLYGAEMVLLQLAQEHQKMGIEPLIASIGKKYDTEKPLESEARRRGIEIKPFRMQPGPNLIGAFEIMRYAAKEGVDLFHSHGYKSNILFGFLPRRLRQRPMVTTLHGWTWDGGFNKLGVYAWLDRLSLQFIDSVVMVNHALLGNVLQGTHIIKNGIPSDNSSSILPLDPRILEFCKGRCVLGAVGRLSPEKGYSILLDAFHMVLDSFPNARLIILGEGEARRSLEEKLKNLRIEKQVLLPGYVKDAASYFHLFKLMILSSTTEGLPLVVLEAMQAGIPVVATKVGGLLDLLLEGKCGILVPPGQSRLLADGILRLINDPELQLKLSQRGKLHIRDHYSSKAMALEYQEIYNDLIHGKEKCGNFSKVHISTSVFTRKST